MKRDGPQRAWARYLRRCVPLLAALLATGQSPAPSAAADPPAASPRQSEQAVMGLEIPDGVKTTLNNLYWVFAAYEFKFCLEGHAEPVEGGVIYHAEHLFLPENMTPLQRSLFGKGGSVTGEPCAAYGGRFFAEGHSHPDYGEPEAASNCYFSGSDIRNAREREHALEPGRGPVIFIVWCGRSSFVWLSRSQVAEIPGDSVRPNLSVRVPPSQRTIWEPRPPDHVITSPDTTS